MKKALFAAVLLSALLLGCLFPASPSKPVVAVVGKASPEMLSILKSDDFNASGFYFAGSIDPKVVYKGILNNFDIVIVQGEPVCDRNARQVMADAVKAGRKLILIKDACTRLSDDESAYGWDVGVNSLGDVVPVVIGGVSSELAPLTKQSVDGKVKMASPSHPIFNGLLNNFQFHSTLAFVTTPKPNAEILAYLDSSSIGRPEGEKYFAIVESKGTVAGKTIYFSFDPATAKSPADLLLLLNSLEYLGK